MKYILAFLLAAFALLSVSLFAITLIAVNSNPMVRVARVLRDAPRPDVPGEYAYGEAAQRLLALTNSYRAQHGRPPLRFDPRLQACAQARANAGTGFNKFNPHAGMMRDAQRYGWRGPTGENIAWGQRTPEEALDSWIHSGGHRRNMLDNWTVCGMAKAGDRWIQMFGR